MVEETRFYSILFHTRIIALNCFVIECELIRNKTGLFLLDSQNVYMMHYKKVLNSFVNTQKQSLEN
jgi:hypothetical protein